MIQVFNMRSCYTKSLLAGRGAARLLDRDPDEFELQADTTFKRNTRREGSHRED
jgi:hypothetical protein